MIFNNAISEMLLNELIVSISITTVPFLQHDFQKSCIYSLPLNTFLSITYLCHMFAAIYKSASN